MEMEQQLKRLTEALAEESKRRVSVDHQADEIDRRRNELEAQLGQLRQELGDAQKQLHAQQEGSLDEQIKLEARVKQLESAKTQVEQQVRRLTESLAEETRRR